MNITSDKDAFEYVKAHLLKQGRKSVSHNFDEEKETCKYFNDNGLRCAVGSLIKMDIGINIEQLEGRGSSNELVTNAVRLSNPDWSIRENSYVLLERLQGIHDCYETDEWELQLFYMENMFDKDKEFTYHKSEEVL